MKFDELNADQKQQAKQDYLIGLAERGIFIQTIYGKGEDEERDPSYAELADADRLVPDHVMREEGVDYVPEDFDSTEDRESNKVLQWALTNLTMTKFQEANPGFRMEAMAFYSVCKALDWAKESVANYCSGLMSK